MAWFKVDDGFYTSLKFLSIAREQQTQAAGLWLLAGTWSADKMTDGFVPWPVLQMWVYDQTTVDQLIEVGLWVEDTERHGIQFHDWCDYQPSRESLEAKAVIRSEKNKQNVAKRWDKSKSDTTAIQTVYETDTNGIQKDTPEPEPEPEPITSKEVIIKRRATRLPDNFQITDAMKDWAEEKHPAIDIETATANFIDYWMSKPLDATKLDWVATWRTWIRNTKAVTHQSNYRSNADLKLERNRQARDNFLAMSATHDSVKEITTNPDWA